MTNELIFEGIFDKKLDIEFSKSDMSSDSGLILFKPILKKLNLISKISDILHDPRHPLYITHSHQELVEQRIAMMIAGYNDLNDNDFLRKDPVFKLFTKGANSSLDLASTPTIFRLDNVVTIAECKKMVELQVDLYLERNQKRFELEIKQNGFLTISLNLDPTDVTTYGEQQLALFNGYYGDKCFLPMVITDGTNGDLICGFLRPGTKHACWCLESILRRLFNRIEEKYGKVHYHVRADSGFQKESFFSFLERKANLTYEIALASNSSLKKITEGCCYTGAEIIFEEDNVLKTYNEFGYKADSWTHFRRVVIKIEINRHGVDVRFIATNGTSSPLKTLESYHQRCNIENRIKELKNHAGGSRLSANEFSSNFFRFSLACFVVICFEEFKKKLTGIKFENCYISTIREKFIKVAGIIKISLRRVLLELSRSHPSNEYWGKILST